MVAGLRLDHGGRGAAGASLSPADLRALQDMLAACPGDLAARTCDALRRILDGEDPRLVLGVKAASSGPSPLMQDRIDRRNALIRAYAQRWCTHEPVSRQADGLIAVWSRYQRSAAKADARLPSMPASYRGQPAAQLFELARMLAPSGGTLPAKRRLIDILSNGKPD